MSGSGHIAPGLPFQTEDDYQVLGSKTSCRPLSPSRKSDVLRLGCRRRLLARAAAADGVRSLQPSCSVGYVGSECTFGGMQPSVATQAAGCLLRRRRSRLRPHHTDGGGRRLGQQHPALRVLSKSSCRISKAAGFAAVRQLSLRYGKHDRLCACASDCRRAHST